MEGEGEGATLSPTLNKPPLWIFMTLTEHLAFTGAAAVVLAPFVTPLELAAFATGSVLIDVDHYILYVSRTGRFGIASMFRYFHDLQPIQRSIPYIGLCFFHTIDILLLIALLSFLHPLFAFIAAGCLYHFVLDLYHLRREKVLFIRAYFLLEHLIRRRAPGYPWY